MGEPFSDHNLNRPCMTTYFYFSFPHLLPLAISNLEAVLQAFNERHWWQSYFLITISIIHVYLHISYFSFPHLLPLAIGYLEALSQPLLMRFNHPYMIKYFPLFTPTFVSLHYRYSKKEMFSMGNTDDNWNWSCDQFLVKFTKLWSRWQLELIAWPIFGKNCQNLIQWQLELLARQIFDTNYQNLVMMTIGIGRVTNFW